MSNPKQPPLPKRRAPWQNVERHYCAICNAWMGSDRQSIMLHENGKKHQENSERALLNKRMEKKEEEQANKFLADSIRQMEQAALQQQQQQLQPIPVTSTSVSYPSSQQLPDRLWTSNSSSTTAIPLPPPPQQKQQPKSNGNNQQQQLKEWQTRKKQRQEIEQLKKQNEQTGQEDDLELYQPVTKRHKAIDPDHGHYNINGTTYLEGQVFAGILESDMPIQLWTGSNLATPQERVLPANSMYWKNALILSVYHPTPTSKQGQINHDTTNNNVDLTVTPIVHVTYLTTVDSPEETIEKNVALDRIRIQLGADSSIPNTIEEARLLAMGGEEVVEIVEPISHQPSEEQVMVLEATGLSSWSTVSVKKTTIRQYDKEEKQRAVDMAQQAQRKQEMEQRRIEERRLEEAKVSNADDSALGAYDVWGKGDYKGIDISKDVTLSIDDTAKKLSTSSHPTTSGPIVFRKTKKKINSGKQRRKLNIDD